MQRLRQSLRKTIFPINTRRHKIASSIFNLFRVTRVKDMLHRLPGMLPAFINKPLRQFYRRVQIGRLKSKRLAIDKIINQYAPHRTCIIFPPSLDWDTQLFQRPQQLALALARQGALVFYCQPKVSRNKSPLIQISEGLYLSNIPVIAYSDIAQLYIYLLTWNCDYASVFDHPCIIYDYVDEIETFYGDHAQMAIDHAQLIQKSHLILTTAKRLFEEIVPARPDAVRTSPPADLQPILALGKPIIGYYGALARWLDYNLIKQLALLRPEFSFVLIGPDYDGTLSPSQILDIDNIFWLGVKPYPQIPDYLHYFDVGTIPFLVNNITHAVSPLKLFEYMAGGKPVVITPMEESMRFPGVLSAATVEEFSDKLDQALLLSQDTQYLNRIDQVARQNTWNARARQILDALSE
jgi:glycosyltransferase involved in cell wall biosynthesis